MNESKRRKPPSVALAVVIAGAVFAWSFPYYLFHKDDDFHEAVSRGDVAEEIRFLDSGKDPDARGTDPNDEGGSALAMALSSNNYVMADLLVRRGADVNRREAGRSLLYQCAKMNYPRAYSWLLERGATPDPTTEALLRLPSSQRYRR